MDANRVVLISGGTSGIGLETVRQFATTGHQVYSCSRNKFEFESCIGETAAAQVKHSTVDVGRPDQLTAWIHSVGESEGRVDVLVNNAAFVVKEPVEEFSSADFGHSLNVNLLSVLESTKAAIPFLERSGHGVLINLSSMAAIDPFPGFSIYGGCKAFIEVFTRAVAKELTEKKIHCFSIRAGAVETPLLRQVLPDFPKEDTIQPGQIAELIYRLALSPSKFLNGEPIEITTETISRLDLA